MPTPPISRLRRVPVREVWQTEAQGFTPWLASSGNLPLLGETIGLRLEVTSTEEPVGNFRADIVCKSLPEGDLVLIENQFAHTDHTHLGQILTYAAGLDAITIVWVAERFREEHRAAIDWLNDKTPENISFFALEIELWRIDDSPVAPKFNVICKPNEWTRSIAEATRPTSEQREFRWSYWSSFASQPALTSIHAHPVKPNHQGNLPIPTAWQNFILQVYVSKTEGACGIFLSCRGLEGLRNFQQLEASKEAIERAVGHPLRWESNENLNRAWVTLDVQGLDPTDRGDWPRQQQILAEQALLFYRAFDPFIRPLDSPLLE